MPKTKLQNVIFTIIMAFDHGLRNGFATISQSIKVV